jgi:hypothetical protein
MSDKHVAALKRTKSGAIDHAYYRVRVRDLRSEVFVQTMRLMGNALLRCIHAVLVGPMRGRPQQAGMSAVDGDKIIQEAKAGF